MLITFLHKDGYDASMSTFRTHNGLFIPPLGSILLSVPDKRKSMNLFFDIISRSKFFRVKLGIPWMVAMNVIPSVVHKYLKFIHEGFVHVIHDTGYRPSVVHGSYSLKHFFTALIGPLLPRKDLLHWTYQKYKKGHLMPRVRYPPSPYVVSHKACLKADSDVAKAHRREEENPPQVPSSSSFFV